jgi:crossover junction endodeoxyribonuclease RuvC
MPFVKRLDIIFNEMSRIFSTYKIDAMSIEKLFFNTNTTTAIDVAQARGVIVLAAQQKGLKIHEYTPLQVKQAVTGYGRAEKHQVMEMVKSLLSLKAVPKPDDTADALAIAICDGHYSDSILRR